MSITAPVFKEQGSKPALRVVAGVLTKNGKYFCAQRAKGHSMAEKWEFPGGKIEQNETAASAIARELWEELAVRAVVKQKLIYLEYEYSDFYLKLEVFLCETEDTPLLKEHTNGGYRTIFELKALPWDECDIHIIEKLEADF